MRKGLRLLHIKPQSWRMKSLRLVWVLWRDVRSKIRCCQASLPDLFLKVVKFLHPIHYVTKHLQQGIESDHFRVKRPMPRIGGFQSFRTARRTIRGFEAMLWL
jgi:transposase-like protein